MKFNREKLTKALWLVAGILLIFTGVLAMIYPVGMLTSITLIFGVSMLISGVFDLAVYFFYRKTAQGLGTLLTDAIITGVLGIFFLSNSWISVAVLPALFGMWMLVTGVCRMVYSADMKKAGFKSWFWFLLLGAGGVIAGFCCMFEPVAAVVAVGIIIGISLILQGAASLLKWFFEEKFMQ